MQTSSQDTIKKILSTLLWQICPNKFYGPPIETNENLLIFFSKVELMTPWIPVAYKHISIIDFKHFQWSLNCVTGFYMLFKSKRKSLRFWSLSHRLIINYIFVFMVFVGTWEHDWLFMNRNKFFLFFEIFIFIFNCISILFFIFLFYYK